MQKKQKSLKKNSADFSISEAEENLSK